LLQAARGQMADGVETERIVSNQRLPASRPASNGDDSPGVRRAVTGALIAPWIRFAALERDQSARHPPAPVSDRLLDWIRLPKE